MATPHNDSPENIWKRLLSAAVNQPAPSKELKEVVNALLTLRRSRLRLREHKEEE